MKKIFTLFAAAAMAVSLQAQVVMVDLAGNEHGNGSTFTIMGEVEEGEVWFESPSVKNNGSSSVDVKLGVDIKQLPANTAVQECFATNCFFFDEAGYHETNTVNIAAGTTKNAMTEWQCYNAETDAYEEGICVIEFTIFVDGQPTSVVTVRYVNGEDSHLNSISSNNATITEAYTMLGQRVSANHKGVVIQKLSDGTVRKVVNK